MRLEWTETATTTLDAIVAYLADESDESIARDVERRIIARVGQLLTFPQSGR